MMIRAMPHDPPTGHDSDRDALALRSALPTSRHAEMVVDSLGSLLGARAVIETAGHGTTTTIYCRDRDHDDWLVPWPILRFARGQRLGWVQGAEGPPSNAPPPASDAPPPRLSGVMPGELEIYYGEFSFTWTYGEDGRIAETCRGHPVERLAELARATTDTAGNPVENLIDYLATLDPGRLGSGRVQRPVPSPASVEGPWRLGLARVRDAIFDGRLPGDARWVAVDGFAGSVLCASATRDDAIARCRDEIARVRPVPPPPEPPPELPPEIEAQIGAPGGYFMISAPGADAPPGVEATAANTPIALMELAPLPAEPPPFGRWIHVFDERGAPGHALLRRDERGITLIGNDVLGQIDPAEIDEHIDAADRNAAVWMEKLLARERHPDLPPLDCLILRYALESRAARAPQLALRGTSQQHGFSGRMLRAEEVARGVVRQRWLAAE